MTALSSMDSRAGRVGATSDVGHSNTSPLTLTKLVDATVLDAILIMGTSSLFGCPLKLLMLK